MIPISDSVQVRRPAWVTASLVTACVVVFLYEIVLPERALEQFIQRWGASPHLLLLALAGDPRVPRSELLTLFTAQFLHGGWLHLLGNMIFLWVFGRAVEDRYGHARYLAIYLLGGAAALVFQAWLSGPRDVAVLIGASGAIAAVLGLYLVSFPAAWVRVLVPVFFFFWFFDVPAALMLALWFLGQFFTGIFSISRVVAPGNVAVWAHVAGFVVGMGVGLLLPRPAAQYRGRGGAPTAGAPGPAGLVRSVAALAVLVLAVRVLAVFLEVRPSAGILGQLGLFAYTATEPFVWPLERVLPWVPLAGRPVDLPAVALIVIVLMLAGGLTSRIEGRSRGRPGRR